MTGANQVTGTIDGQYIEVETKDSTSINITIDGKSAIYARTVDNAGNISDVKSVNAWKDAVPPTAVNLSIDSKTDKTVTVNTSSEGTDTTSGIAKYVFEYKTSTEVEWTTATEEASLLSSYEYTGLTSGTTYNFRIKTIDNAGNESTGTEVTETPEEEVVLTEADIGKVVDYVQPTDRTYTISKEYSGYTTDVELASADFTENWIFWAETDDDYLLITEASVGPNVGLTGAKGFHNGVTLLDSANEALFLNLELYPDTKCTNMKYEHALIGLSDAGLSKISVSNITKSSFNSKYWPKIWVTEVDAFEASRWYTETFRGKNLERAQNFLQMSVIHGSRKFNSQGEWLYYGSHPEYWKSDAMFNAMQSSPYSFWLSTRMWTYNTSQNHREFTLASAAGNQIGLSGSSVYSVTNTSSTYYNRGSRLRPLVHLPKNKYYLKSTRRFDRDISTLIMHFGDVL